MQDQLKSPDVFGRTFQLDRATVDVMAARLEARGKHPFFIRTIEHYMTRLDLPAGSRLLDLGSGTGVAARTIARQEGFTGRITAVDISSDLIEMGRRHAEAEGLADRIEFTTGDVHRLDFTEGSFDAVVAHTLISHVADPPAVLAEARRLLRPEGKLVVFDGDYASLTFTTDDPDHGKATDEALISGVVAQPRVMRIMPRLLAAAGLQLAEAHPYIVADIGRADYFAPLLPTLRVLLPKAGVMSNERANSFVDDQERASAAGRFFASSNFYTYIARRPA